MALIAANTINLDEYDSAELGQRGVAEADLLSFVAGDANEALMVYKVGTVQALKTARDKHGLADVVGIRIIGKRTEKSYKVTRGDKSYKVTREVWQSRDYIMLSKTDTSDHDAAHESDNDS
jgi:hypothetical protein